MIVVKRLLAAVFVSALGLGAAQAATEQPYSQSAFDAAEAAGKPILLHITAPWCPTCAKQHPILESLYKEPANDALQVFDIDFDTSKPLLQKLHVQMQSTLIAYHGDKEIARTTGITSEPAIRELVAKTGS